MNPLSAELLSAQENSSRFPLVEIKAGQFAEDLPLAGQRLNRETLDQSDAASITHSTGRLITVYTQDEYVDTVIHSARSVRLVYTDPERIEFAYVYLFSATGTGKLSDLSLVETADGKLTLAYVFYGADGKYSINVAALDYDGTGLEQYTIQSAQTLALYSPSLCRTDAGILLTYIQEIAISATKGGTYVGTGDSTFSMEVTADGTETTALFQWRKGTAQWSADVTMNGSAQPLADGVTIRFNAGTYWSGQKFWYTVTAARFAAGLITFAALPSHNDTVIIGSQTYTWKTALSSPAVANEIKIDPLGREICAENLRCAVVAGTYEGTGAGVRYGTGTLVSTEVTATRDEYILTLTAIATGTAGNSLMLTVDNTRLTKAAFAGGAASVIGTLQWTPGSKLYQTTATLPSGSWTTAVESGIYGVLASRKKLDTCLLRQTNGALWLFFTYMQYGDTETTAVYNLYYCTSPDNGSTWSSAVSLTAFETPAEIARRPAVVQKLATEIIAAYDSVKTSLTMDKTNPYWTDEAVQSIKHIHFNDATRKLYATYGYSYFGTKCVYGIVRIDVDSWTIDRYWNGNTIPQIPLFFRENHVFHCHGKEDHVVLLAEKAQLCILDDSANTITVLSLEDNSAYGVKTNVSGVPWDSVNHYESLNGVHIEPSHNTVYFGFLKSGNTATMKIITIDYTEASPACTVLSTFTTNLFGTDPEVLSSSGGTFRVDVTNGYLLYCTEGTSHFDVKGSLRIFMLNGGGLYKHYLYQDALTGFPYYGVKDPVIMGGKIYAAQYLYTTAHSQSAYWGMLSIDLATDALKWYAPSSILTGGPVDARMGGLTKTMTGTLVGSSIGGVAVLDTQTEIWGLLNNTTTPGIFPTGLTSFVGSLFAYDSRSELIFLGAQSVPNTFTGVVAFPAAGKIEQTQYFDGLYTGGTWTFGAGADLVLGSRDYSAALAVDPDTHSLYAFWTRWNSSEGQQVYWDKEAGTLDLTGSIVRGQAIQQTRSIDGQPGKLSFALAKGHLFDPHNQASLLSRYLRKGKKISLRWGEKIGGTEYWQTGTSSYVLSGVKLSYQRGSYPVIAVGCEDRRTLWDNMGIVATPYYSGIAPDAVLSSILQNYAAVELSDIELSALRGEDVLYHQWLDTTIKNVVESMTNRYGYFIDVSLADNTLVARKLSPHNAVDHVYSSASNLLDFSPDDSFSAFTNRVVVTGEGRAPIDVETAEESVGSESGTLGFFQHKQTRKIYYSDDHQKRAVRPRLDVTQNVSSIGFMLAGRMRMGITAVDPEDHWVEVTAEGPNLLPVLIAAIAMFVAGKNQPPAVGTISEPAESKRGSWLKDAGLYIALQCLAAVGNYAFTIYACPVGEVKQTFQATADDTQLQNELRGTIIETRLDEPLAYDIAQAQAVADRELWITQAQRKRVKFSKTAHLQDDAGDTLQIPHPYTNAPLTVFVTNLTRTMTIPVGSGSGDYTDQIEGWVL